MIINRHTFFFAYIFIQECQPWINVGENNIIYQYPYNTYSDISFWLDNIIDEIDIRDTASLLIAERYLSSLYCLPTDYLSGCFEIYNLIFKIYTNFFS